MGLGGGVECAAHAGLHLREADLLFEVVDPLTGAPLPVGSEGEIVFTTLTREAMPLIRYRTGDSGSFIAEPCPCGSALRLLATVRERLRRRRRARRRGAAEPGRPRRGAVRRRRRRRLSRPPRESDATGDGALRAPLVMGLRAGWDRAGAGRHYQGSAPDAPAALERLPAVARAHAAGRLRVEVTTAVAPWSGGDGTGKRTLRDERQQETR